MNRYTIEKSLYDPIEVAVGDKVYRAVPLSRAVVRQLNQITERLKNGTKDAFDAIVEQFSLMFDVPLEEADLLDVALLAKAVVLFNDNMNDRRERVIPSETPAAETHAPTEVGEPAGELKNA